MLTLAYSIGCLVVLRVWSGCLLKGRLGGGGGGGGGNGGYGGPAARPASGSAAAAMRAAASGKAQHDTGLELQTSFRSSNDKGAPQMQQVDV